jgi:hypothetical protein
MPIKTGEEIGRAQDSAAGRRCSKSTDTKTRIESKRYFLLHGIQSFKSYDSPSCRNKRLSPQGELGADLFDQISGSLVWRLLRARNQNESLPIVISSLKTFLIKGLAVLERILLVELAMTTRSDRNIFMRKSREPLLNDMTTESDSFIQFYLACGRMGGADLKLRP